VAESVFEAELPVDFHARIEQVTRTRDGVQVQWVGGDERPREESFQYVLAATGRSPNVKSLGLEHLGLSLSSQGIPTFDRETLQCGDHPVFIAGDANAEVPLLHEAADEGRIAGGNAARFPEVEVGLRRSPIAVVFSDPEIAAVGQGYRDLDQAETVIGEVSFEDQGRSRVMLRNKGVLRVYADRQSGRFLGAEMIGPDAEHLAHLLAWAHQAKMTIETMLDMPFYHPVIEEGLRTALRDVNQKRKKALSRELTTV
jgi:dihydrolipoamide dehydrogenase